MPHGHRNIGNIDRPDLVWGVYSVVSEKIGNDGLFEVSFREIGFGVNGINRHQLHQTPDSFTSHLVAILTELYGDFSRAQIREFYMPVVNTPHQFLLLRDTPFIG